jgi:hypothetical protein
VTAPAIVIRVEFERVEPVVFSDYLDDGDESRMAAWLDRRPELAALIERALELAEQERAA